MLKDQDPSSETDLFSSKISYNEERKETSFVTFTDEFTLTIEADSEFNVQRSLMSLKLFRLGKRAFVQ